MAQMKKENTYFPNKLYLSFAIALENLFAVQLLEKDKQSILSDKSGSTMVHITKAGMEGQVVVLLSDVKEQEKTEELFTSLDSLLPLYQRKCGQLKNIKKALLEQIFARRI